MLTSISPGYVKRTAEHSDGGPMATRSTTREQTKPGIVCRASFGRDLQARRVLAVELPEFLIYALEQRVLEANADASPEDVSTLDYYIEAELSNLITVRDVAELEAAVPGFAAAVQHWLGEIAK